MASQNDSPTGHFRTDPVSTRLRRVRLLVRDLRAYLAYRRRSYYAVQHRHNPVRGVESVHFGDALAEIAAYRFPDRNINPHGARPVAVTPDTTHPEFIFLSALVRMAEPRHVFEIGTYEGRTTNLLALHTPPGAKVETLDLPPEEMTAAAYEIESYDQQWVKKENTRVGLRIGELDSSSNAKITQHLGDSAKFDFSPWHRRIDLVFVDGAHNYPYVMSDVKNALRMVSQRGIIVLHDYLTHDDVTLACAHLCQRYRVFHVAQTAFAVLLPRRRSD